MTPKEKAKELIEMFSENVSVYYTEDSIPSIMNAPLILKHKKKFAINTVDRLVDLLSEFDGNTRDDLINFYFEVKQELLKI